MPRLVDGGPSGPGLAGSYGGYGGGAVQYPMGPSSSSGQGTSFGAGTSSSTTGAGIVPGALNLYNQLLGVNQNRYNNVLNAYQGGQTNLSGALPGINQGYGNVLGQVENTLGLGGALGGSNWGVAGPAATAIGQAFTQTQGQTAQGLINAGLGNTTVSGNLQNLNAMSAGRAYAGLGAQLAQTAAGYQSQLGMAGLSQAMQGLGMQTGLTQAGLGPLGNPLSNTFGNFIGGFGSSQSRNQQQAQNSQQGQSAGGGGGQRGGGGGPQSPGYGYQGGGGGGGGPTPGQPGGSSSFFGSGTGGTGSQPWDFQVNPDSSNAWNLNGSDFAGSGTIGMGQDNSWSGGWGSSPDGGVGAPMGPYGAFGGYVGGDFSGGGDFGGGGGF